MFQKWLTVPETMCSLNKVTDKIMLTEIINGYFNVIRIYMMSKHVHID